MIVRIGIILTMYITAPVITILLLGIWAELNKLNKGGKNDGRRA